MYIRAKLSMEYTKLDDSLFDMFVIVRTRFVSKKVKRKLKCYIFKIGSPPLYSTRGKLRWV